MLRTLRASALRAMAFQQSYPPLQWINGDAQSRRVDRHRALPPPPTSREPSSSRDRAAGHRQRHKGEERPGGRPTRSKPKSRAHANSDSMLPTLGALGLSRLPGPPLRTSRLPSVELRALVRAAGWLDSREDLAVVRWQLHRLKVTFAGAYDVEGNAHAPRNRFGVVAGLLLGHNATPHFAQWHVVFPTAPSRALPLAREAQSPN